MLILPWLTVPYIGKKAFIRFFPVATFASLVITVLSEMANKKKWYRNKNPLIAKGHVDFTYILGIHFVVTLWVFKLTYVSFPKYIILNVVLDWINAFPYAGLWKKAGLFKFIKMSPSKYWYFTSILAIVLYGYQYLVENVIRQINMSK